MGADMPEIPVWRIECKVSGRGFDFEGDFAAACRKAVSQCTTYSSVWCVWKLPENFKVAEANLRGVRWFAKDFQP
jgi:hypothetical protein